MTSRLTLWLAAAVIAVTLGATGCSSDTVQSGTEALSVRFTPAPPGAGRFGDGSGDDAEFNIFSVNFLPVDPELVGLLDDQPFAMRFGVYDGDLAATTPDEYAAIALSPGTYRITTMRIRPPRFQDSGASQAAPLCIDRVAAIPSGPASIDVPFDYIFDETDDYTFTVSPGDTHIDIAIDVPGLIQAYSAAFTCVDSCGGGNSCLTTYDDAAGRAAIAAHVSFQ